MDLPTQDECTVYGTLGFVLCVSKIFGLAPVKFRRIRRGWSIRHSFAANLYGVAIFCFIFLILIAYLVCDYNMKGHSSNHFKTSSDAVVAIVLTAIAQLVLLVATYSGSQRMQSIITSLAHIRKINADLCQYGPPPSFKFESMTLIPICSNIGAWLNYIIVSSATLYSVFFENKYNFLWLGLHLVADVAIITIKLLILHITLILVAVPVSLHHLNDCLWNLLQEIRNQYSINKPHVTIKRLRTLYGALCYTVKHLNDSHGMLLTVVIPYFIMFLVIPLHNLVMVVVKTDNPNYVLIILLETLWLMLKIADLVMIIEPCHRAYKQIERTKRLIGRMLLFSCPEHHEVIHELELFYKQLMDDVVYIPMGIFYLDRTVIVMVFASITTYLVILVKL